MATMQESHPQQTLPDQAHLERTEISFQKIKEKKSLYPDCVLVTQGLLAFFILKQKQQPQCLICQTPCIVKPILVVCRAFSFIRKWFFKVNSLNYSFENVNMDDKMIKISGEVDKSNAYPRFSSNISFFIQGRTSPD